MNAPAMPPARSPWPDVPMLRIVPPVQLALPLEGDGAAPDGLEVWETGAPGGPSAVVTIGRAPGGGWRVAYGLRFTGAAECDAGALIVPTYGAALAAATFGRGLLAGAVRSHVRAVAPAMLEAVRRAQTTPPPPPVPVDDPAPLGSGRVLPFRSRRPGAAELAPTG